MGVSMATKARLLDEFIDKVNSMPEFKEGDEGADLGDHAPEEHPGGITAEVTKIGKMPEEDGDGVQAHVPMIHPDDSEGQPEDDEDPSDIKTRFKKLMRG